MSKKSCSPPKTSFTTDHHISACNIWMFHMFICGSFIDKCVDIWYYVYQMYLPYSFHAHDLLIEHNPQRTFLTLYTLLSSVKKMKSDVFGKILKHHRVALPGKKVIWKGNKNSTQQPQLIKRRFHYFNHLP